MTFSTLKKVLVIILIGIFFSVSAYSSDIIKPIFPNGGVDVSTAGQIMFQSQYPIDLPDNCKVSPSCYDNSGNRLHPKFYIIPSEHFDETDYLNLYAVPCQMFISDLNVITIVPSRPFDYGRNYSVVFKELPILKPDITKPNGYERLLIDAVFYEFFTTIGYPTHVADISFEKTGNKIWCNTEKITVNFNKPILANSNVLQGMFKITQVGDVINNPDGTINYGSIDVPLTAALTNGGKSAEITTNVPFEYGGDYWLSTHFENYLGNDDMNSSYSFSVPNEIIVSVEAYNPDGDILPAECVNAGFGGYRRYKIGETAELVLPEFVENEEYYIAGWELPDGTVIQHGGGNNNLYFNCNNTWAFLSNYSHALPDGELKIRVRYERNPIDTIEIDVHDNYGLAASCWDFRDGVQIENSIAKISSHEFTYYRYSYKPLHIAYKPTCFDNSEFEMAFRANFYFSMYGYDFDGLYKGEGDQATIHRGSNRMLMYVFSTARFHEWNGDEMYYYMGEYSPLASHLGVSSGRWRLGNFYIEDPRNPGGGGKPSEHTVSHCFSCTYEAEVIFAGINYGGFEPDIADNAANTGFITISLDGQTAQLTGNCQHGTQQVASITSAKSRIPFEVTVNHPDYEIYLIKVGSGNNIGGYAYECEVNNGAVTVGYPTNIYFNNYSLTKTASHVSGILKAVEEKCKNKITVYVRRKVVEFQFDVVMEDPAAPHKTKSVPAFAVAHMKFEQLPGNSLPLILGSSINAETVSYLGKAAIEDGIYLRHPKETSTSGGRTIPIREKTSVFFYSGSTFTATPYFMENTGYSFKEYVEEPALHVYDMNPQSAPPNSVKVHELRKKDKVVLLANEAFKLKAIGVQKIKANSTDNFTYYNVENVSNDKHPDGYAPWKDNTQNPDSGVGMLHGTGDGYHSMTTQIKFVFSSPFDLASARENIKIHDMEANIWGDIGNYIRPDGNNRVNIYPYYDYSTTPLSDQHIFEVTLVKEVGNKSKPAICHLQPFKVTINNTDNAHVKSEDLAQRMANLKRVSEANIFKAITVPPGISIKAQSVHNYKWVEPTYWDDPEPIIHAYTISDNEGGIFNITDFSELSKIDNEGRATYSVATYKGPKAGETLDRGDSIVWVHYNNAPMFESPRLFDRQRILHNYHWIDYGNSWVPWHGMCEAAINGINSSLASSLGKANFFTIAFNLITSKMCSSGWDHQMGHNTFWLEQKHNNSNNKYYIYNINETKIEQDWNLWGAGKYGMYQEEVEKHSYQEAFEYKQIRYKGNLFGGKLYIDRINVPTGVVMFGTKIKITLLGNTR